MPRFKRFNVTAEITSQINDSTAWAGTVAKVPADSPKAAAKCARAFIADTVTEHDDRIQPTIHILEIQALIETPEELTLDIVAAADRHGEDTGEPDHTVGDLQQVLQTCIALLTAKQRSHFLQSLHEQELLGKPTITKPE